MLVSSQFMSFSSLTFSQEGRPRLAYPRELIGGPEVGAGELVAGAAMPITSPDLEILPGEI